MHFEKQLSLFFTFCLIHKPFALIRIYNIHSVMPFFASCQHCTAHHGQRLYVLKVWPCQRGNLLTVKARRKTQSPTLDFFEYDCGKDRSMCLVVGAGDEICETFWRGKTPNVWKQSSVTLTPECKTTIFRTDCLCQWPNSCLFVN